ncbi:hypothetical protein H257_13573 [Aphanomyces astaci]|uniref:Uncharacterized protein n=1 Tax=Aphanomyces astaci TaxID=112090 RepID=W4FW86_APHAT|nr:hypothetical protein H257_13573 [Aphanomyces astaci]ETV71191.1 hypothetical protein H257_13573 [Aphanomyces astaci]|eukprot:XP_009839437.1 hypothetical protein H257_13573 [Aphanomyces astaci]
MMSSDGRILAWVMVKLRRYGYTSLHVVVTVTATVLDVPQQVEVSSAILLHPTPGKHASILRLNGRLLKLTAPSIVIVPLASEVRVSLSTLSVFRPEIHRASMVYKLDVVLKRLPMFVQGSGAFAAEQFPTVAGSAVAEKVAMIGLYVSTSALNV